MQYLEIVARRKRIENEYRKFEGMMDDDLHKIYMDNKLDLILDILQDMNSGLWSVL